VTKHITYENIDGPGCRKVPLNENMQLYTIQNHSKPFPIITIHFFRTSILKISYHLFLGLQKDCLTGGFPTKFYKTSVVSNHSDMIRTSNAINVTTLTLPGGLGNHKVLEVIE